MTNWLSKSTKYDQTQSTFKILFDLATKDATLIKIASCLLGIRERALCIRCDKNRIYGSKALISLAYVYEKIRCLEYIFIMSY